MADVLRHPSLKIGSTAETLKTKSENAKLALASPEPTWKQAREAVHRLLSSWSEELVTDARRDGIAEIFMHFPLEVINRCADRWDGIACTKIPDRTGKLQPRRFPPSDGEIRDWCAQYRADLWELAKSGEIINRPSESSQQSQPEKPRPPPTVEEIARVWARVNEVRESAKRVLGEPTSEERRDCAERILSAARRAAEERG
jgi:hypothetical protein